MICARPIHIWLNQNCTHYSRQIGQNERSEKKENNSKKKQKWFSFVISRFHDTVILRKSLCLSTSSLSNGCEEWAQSHLTKVCLRLICQTHYHIIIFIFFHSYAMMNSFIVWTRIFVPFWRSFLLCNLNVMMSQSMRIRKRIVSNTAALWIIIRAVGNRTEY